MLLIGFSRVLGKYTFRAKIGNPASETDFSRAEWRPRIYFSRENCRFCDNMRKYILTHACWENILFARKLQIVLRKPTFRTQSGNNYKEKLQILRHSSRLHAWEKTFRATIAEPAETNFSRAKWRPQINCKACFGKHTFRAQSGDHEFTFRAKTADFASRLHAWKKDFSRENCRACAETNFSRAKWRPRICILRENYRF